MNKKEICPHCERPMPNRLGIDDVREIVDYLNEKTFKKQGKRFRADNRVTIKHIRARFNEGYGVQDFKDVIDKRVAEWGGTAMAQYLRPETLFAGKFESYLVAETSGSSSIDENFL